MKLILTAAVENLGEAGDTVEVKDGYGRNYLLPRGLAIKATRGAEKQIDSIKQARAARELSSLEDAQALAAKLTSTTLTVPVKSGAEGRLFGTVRAGDIASAVETAGLGSIDKRRVDLTQRIKTTGVYQAVIHLHEDVNANVEFEVVPA